MYALQGIVTETRSGVTKNGKPFGGFTLQDYTDSFTFLLFDKDYVTFSNFFDDRLSAPCKRKGAGQAL